MPDLDRTKVKRAISLLSENGWLNADSMRLLASLKPFVLTAATHLNPPDRKVAGELKKKIAALCRKTIISWEKGGAPIPLLSPVQMMKLIHDTGLMFPGLYVLAIWKLTDLARSSTAMSEGSGEAPSELDTGASRVLNELSRLWRLFFERYGTSQPTRSVTDAAGTSQSWKGLPSRGDAAKVLSQYPGLVVRFNHLCKGILDDPARNLAYAAITFFDILHPRASSSPLIELTSSLGALPFSAAMSAIIPDAYTTRASSDSTLGYFTSETTWLGETLRNFPDFWPRALALSRILKETDLEGTTKGPADAVHTLSVDVQPQEAQAQELRSESEALLGEEGDILPHPAAPRPQLLTGLTATEERFIMSIRHATQHTNLLRIDAIYRQAQLFYGTGNTNEPTTDQAASQSQSSGPFGIKAVLPLPIYNSVLRAYMDLRSHARVLEVWTDLRNSGVTPDVISWQILIRGLRDARNMPMLEVVWQQMLQAGIQLDETLWATRLSALAAHTHWTNALRELNDLGKDWLKAVDQKFPDRTDPATNQPLDLYSVGDVAGRVKPTSMMVGFVMNRVSHVQVGQTAQRLMEWCDQLGIRRDAHMYKAVVGAHLVRGDFRAAMDLLSDMAARAIVLHPSLRTRVAGHMFLRVLDDCRDGPDADAEQLRRVLEVIARLERCGFAFNVHMYGQLIHMLLRDHGNAHAAKVVYEQMLGRRIAPSVEIVTSLMQHHAAQEPADVGAIEALWSEALARKVPLNYAFYDWLIKLHCRLGRLERVMYFVHRLEGLGQDPRWSVRVEALRCMLKFGNERYARQLIGKAQAHRDALQDPLSGGARMLGRYAAQFFDLVDALEAQGLEALGAKIREVDRQAELDERLRAEAAGEGGRAGEYQRSERDEDGIDGVEGDGEDSGSVERGQGMY